MEGYRLAGSRIVGFPHVGRQALVEVAERLIAHESQILDRWLDRQFQVWAPPGLEREQVRALFGDILHGMLARLAQGEPERCVAEMEGYGARLAGAGIPFEALMISIHFLEESYMPFLLAPPSPRAQTWLIRLDEFLHAALGAIATSYFETYRAGLLAEAEIGHAIQEGLSPNLPKTIGSLEVGHVYVSATERARLGGDFLDIFSLEGGRVAFIIGDIAGHGLDAVIDAVTIRSLFRGFMRENADLVGAFERLNRVLPYELEADQFATVLAGACGAAGACAPDAPMDISLVNAGSPFPILCGDQCALVEHPGFPLAVVPETGYAPRSVTLRPGELLVAYTDGLSEARHGHGCMFGEEGVLRALAQVRDLPPRSIAEHLLDRALAHARGQVSDDISVLVLRRAVG